MAYYIVKLLITSLLIVAIGEIAKRSTLAGAILASIPLISVLAMVWLYIDTGDSTKVSTLATSVFWLVLPSLALFISLPLLLKYNLNFYLSLGIAIALTVACYWLMLTTLNHYGIKL